MIKFSHEDLFLFVKELFNICTLGLRLSEFLSLFITKRGFGTDCISTNTLIMHGTKHGKHAYHLLSNNYLNTYYYRVYEMLSYFGVQTLIKSPGPDPGPGSGPAPGPRWPPVSYHYIRSMCAANIIIVLNIILLRVLQKSISIS